MPFCPKENEIGQKLYEKQMRENKRMGLKREELEGKQEHAWREINEWKQECEKKRRMAQQIKEEQSDIVADQCRIRAQAAVGGVRHKRLEEALKEMTVELERTCESMKKIDKSQRKQLEKTDKLTETSKEESKTIKERILFRQDLCPRQ